MKRQDYYPGTVGNQILWLKRFASSLPAHADALRLSAAVLADAIADALWVAYTLGPWRTAVRAFAKAATAAMEAVQTGTGRGANGLPGFTAPPLGDAVPRPSGALKRIFRLVQIIKVNSGYNEPIGRQLGLLTLTDDREHPAPSLEVTVERGEVRERAVLKMEKWGHTGLYIEGRRGGGDWEKLGITTEVTFFDERPLLVPGQPEVREYRVRYFEDSSPTGEWSPVVMVTVSP